MIGEKGVDVNIKTEGYFGTAPLIAACKKGKIDLCKYLIASGADLDVKVLNNAPLIAACESGNIELCKYLIEEKSRC